MLDYARDETIHIAMISFGMRNGEIIKELAKRGGHIARGAFGKVNLINKRIEGRIK